MIIRKIDNEVQIIKEGWLYKTRVGECHELWEKDKQMLLWNKITFKIFIFNIPEKGG